MFLTVRDAFLAAWQAVSDRKTGHLEFSIKCAKLHNCFIFMTDTCCQAANPGVKGE